MADIVIPCPTWKDVKPWIYRIAGLAIILYVAYLVREIWMPLSIAFLIALVLDPVVDRMERKGFSRTTGAAIIFGGFLIVIVGVLFVSIPPVIDQVSSIQQRIQKVIPDGSPGGLDHMLEKQNISPMVRSMAKAVVVNAQGSFDKSSALLTGHLIEYASNLIWLVIVPIVAFYALRDFHLILGKLLLLVKPGKRDIVQSGVTEVTAVFAKYMRGLTIVSALNGLATWLLLAVLGVPSSFVLGVFAGVLYSVPYIGALITVVLISVVSFLAGGANHMLIVLGASIVLHQIIFDQIVTPRIVGGHVGLHPILAIVALLAGNALVGLIGMVLAVPVAACIQIGVLALIPKLRHEIPSSSVEQPIVTEEITKEEDAAKLDATRELHQSVALAVEEIDEKAPIEEKRRVKILGRRRRRAAGTDP